MTLRKAVRRVSRHKKSYWRKGTDVKDVEDHLQDIQEQQAFGGLLVEKPDTELFTHDTSFQSVAVKVKSELGVRPTRKQKELKCFSGIAPNPLIKPAVAAPLNLGSGKARKRWVNKFSTGQTDIKPVVLRSMKEQLKTLCFEKTLKPVTLKSECATGSEPSSYDLWDVAEGPLKHNLSTKKTPKPPKTLRAKVTKLPAVEVVAPGASYNPTFEEYRKLATRAAEVEQRKEKAEEKLLRKLTLPPGQAVATEADYILEMSQGLFDEKEVQNTDEQGFDEAHGSGSAEGGETYFCPSAPVTSNKKKLRQQRLKEAQRKAKAAEKLRKKQEQRSEHQFFRLKSIKKELTKRDQETAKKAAEKAAQKLHSQMYGATRLSRHKFEEAELEVLLPEELPSSLRLLKPEGSVVEDRFKSLQKRNIVETRVPQKHKRKHKRKAYETRSYKSVTIDGTLR